MKRSSVVLALVLASLSAGNAWGQAYPNRPIRVLVPFAAGGAVDTLARIVGQKLSESIGQPVIIENRPGAGGVTGTELVTKSSPDGYTLLGGNPGPLTIASTVRAQIPYDTLRDLAPIVLVAKSASCMCVHPSMPVKGIKDFVALAKAQPGRINYATPGVGTVGHLAIEFFSTSAGVKMNHVPYKGAAQYATDLVAGHIEMAQLQFMQSAPLVNQGRLRCLGVTSSVRTPLLPDVPTIAEQGIKGFSSYNWNGVLAPAATPKAIIARIHEVVAKQLKTPEARDLYVGQGHEISGDGPEEYAAFLRVEIEKWARVAKAAGIPKQ
jgi:tripartite-type tricarboxylate transporter receptor subunit TctC